MKKIYAAILTVAAAAHVEAVKIDRVFDREVAVREVNYDKSKIGEYTLEDPLEFLDGRKVDAKTWPERRREMLGIFAREMYGVEPPPPTTLLSELVDEKSSALAGFAVRRQYKMYFKPDRSGPCVNWIVWLPRHAKKPVPVILFLNYRGNHELVADPDIPVQSGWKSDSKVHRVTNNRASEATVPAYSHFFQTGKSAQRRQIPHACVLQIQSFQAWKILQRRYILHCAPRKT